MIMCVCDVRVYKRVYIFFSLPISNHTDFILIFFWRRKKKHDDPPKIWQFNFPEFWEQILFNMHNLNRSAMVCFLNFECLHSRTAQSIDLRFCSSLPLNGFALFHTHTHAIFVSIVFSLWQKMSAWYFVGVSELFGFVHRTISFLVE